MIKVLVFFVLGAATLYFIIRALVNTEPGKLSRVIKIIIFAAIIIAVVFMLTRGNLGFLAPIIGIARRLLVGF